MQCLRSPSIPIQSTQQCAGGSYTLTLTLKGDSDSPIDLIIQVLGLWEETGISGGKNGMDVGRICNRHTSSVRNLLQNKHNMSEVLVKYNCNSEAFPLKGVSHSPEASRQFLQDST